MNVPLRTAYKLPFKAAICIWRVKLAHEVRHKSRMKITLFILEIELRFCKFGYVYNVTFSIKNILCFRVDSECGMKSWASCGAGNPGGTG